MTDRRSPIDMTYENRPRWEDHLPKDGKTDVLARTLARRRERVAEVRKRLDAEIVMLVDAERTLANAAWKRHGEDATERAMAAAIEEAAAAPERIATVAILRDDGAMATVARPGRHHDLIFLLALEGHPPIGPDAQGFATTRGRFVDRKEGLAIAQANGQVIRKHPSFDMLYSEDMW